MKNLNEKTKAKALSNLRIFAKRHERNSTWFHPVAFKESDLTDLLETFNYDLVSMYDYLRNDIFQNTGKVYKITNNLINTFD